MDDGTLLWLLLVGAAGGGCAVTLLIQRRLWLVLPLGGAAFALAWWYVAGASREPGDEGWDEFGRVILAGFPLTGWLLGLTVTSVWIVGLRSGEKSRNRSSAARS